jgi:uncharacterized protein YndB with AHSA1/START domain
MKPGFLATTRAVIRKRVAAPRERVFRASTDAEHLRHWFFPHSTELCGGACHRSAKAA